MIHVNEQPEPELFDKNVRQKGLAFLKKKNISLDKPLPHGVEIEPYWRNCLTELHQAYAGTCAYIGIFFERVMGGGSVDHFIAKSSTTQLAYEWRNYRLACSTMNSRKNDYNDVLDPFFLAPNTFRLQLSTGHIYPNPEMDARAVRIAEETIERLKLDDASCRDTRACWYQEYIEYQLPADFLRKRAPFIWYEANRQRLL